MDDISRKPGGNIEQAENAAQGNHERTRFYFGRACSMTRPMNNPFGASGASLAFDAHDRESRFVWLDLEMTGLNSDVDEILEIAVVITGADLQPLGEMTRVIHHTEETLEHMSSTVQRMHSRNGLVKDVLASTTTLREAERIALALVVEHCQPGEAVLCGNGIHYDWRFLVRHMPRLEHYLHYRQIDVSTMKILVETWAPKLVYDAPRSNHRALADTHASISELRHYCEKVFRRADESA